MTKNGPPFADPPTINRGIWTMKKYTEKEATRDMKKLEEYCQQFNRGDLSLDQWIMAIFTIAMQMREARVEYLWSGLYTMGENIPGGKKI